MEYKRKINYVRNFWWPVLKELNLSPSEGLLMTLVEDLSHRQGFCYASKARLADYLNVSVPTVHNAIKRLRYKNLLIRGSVSGFKTSCLQVTKKWNDFIGELEMGLFNGPE